jgi:hypothetical protein
MHGGKSPRGAAHPSFKHGRQSKYAAFVPAQLREAHQRFLADPEARELREEKAIAALVLSEQLRRIGDDADQAAAGGAFLSAQELFADLLAAYAADDRPRVRRLLGEVETALATGATAEHRRRAAVEAEAEARKTLDLSRRLADTDARIVMRRQAFATIAELQALTHRFADLRCHSSDGGGDDRPWDRGGGGCGSGACRARRARGRAATVGAPGDGGGGELMPTRPRALAGSVGDGARALKVLSGR